MTASELITRLQQLIAEHGDLEVACADSDYDVFYNISEPGATQHDALDNRVHDGEPKGPFFALCV
jgi:hypothetical protein